VISFGPVGWENAMARPLRWQYPGALYHITARGNERKNIFRSDQDRKTFLTILARAIERYRLVLHAYVLMDNHYHLLLETREANLARALRDLNGIYTAFFNRTHRRIGHLFQGRYKAILVEKESYLLELSRYIHLNPVRAKMGVRLNRYAWSSYPDYIGNREGPGWLTRDGVLGYFGSNPGQSRGAYRRFVEEGMREGVERPWEKVVGQLALGGERFVQSLRRKIGNRRDREVPSRRQLEARPSWEEIRRSVEAVGMEWQALRTGNRSNPERAVMIYLGRERGNLTLKELAERFGLEASTVSQTAARVAKLRAGHRQWDQLLRRIESGLIPNP